MIHLLLTGVLAVLATGTPPTTASALSHRTFLPAVIRPPVSGDTAFRFSYVGLGSVIQDSKYNDSLLNGLTRYSFQTWSTACNDPRDPASPKSMRHIPVIWGAEQFSDRATMDGLFNGPCNDGRPLFFLNEPDVGNQSAVQPSVAADMFYTMTRGSWPRQRWHGPIYAGGILIEHKSWVDQFITAFADKYNRGSKAIPEIGGWQVHQYPNWAGLRSYSLATLTDADYDLAIANQTKTITDFIAARRSEGNSTALYFSEVGILKNFNMDPTDGGTPDQYSERMAVWMRRMDAMYRSFPEIRGYMWYSNWNGSPLCKTDCPTWAFFPGSNLVHDDGTLNAAGIQWRKLAATN